MQTTLRISIEIILCDNHRFGSRWYIANTRLFFQNITWSTWNTILVIFIFIHIQPGTLICFNNIFIFVSFLSIFGNLWLILLFLIIFLNFNIILSFFFLIFHFLWYNLFEFPINCCLHSRFIVNKIFLVPLLKQIQFCVQALKSLIEWLRSMRLL